MNESTATDRTATSPAPAPVPVVATSDHLAHEGRTELEWGAAVPLLEAPIRAERIAELLGTDDRFTIGPATAHGLAPIIAVHDPGLVRFLETAWARFQEHRSQHEVVPDTFLHPGLREGMGPAPEPADVTAAFGYWCFETATPLTEGTYGAARAAADIALTASGLVADGAPVAYGLCRPPGHHAARSVYGGYCYLNNAAVAAEALVARSGGRVTVLDVDYHHGNGTQQIFYERADVQYVSLHGDPNHAYPFFVGHAEETGAGRGAGANLNLPLPPGTDDAAYLAALARALESIDAFDPAVLVVSLGVDTFEGDPIGDFTVTTEGFEAQGAAIAALGRPTVVLQEGGYDVEHIAANVRAFLLGAAR